MKTVSILLTALITLITTGCENKPGYVTVTSRITHPNTHNIDGYEVKITEASILQTRYSMNDGSEETRDSNTFHAIGTVRNLFGDEPDEIAEYRFTIFYDGDTGTRCINIFHNSTLLVEPIYNEYAFYPEYPAHKNEGDKMVLIGAFLGDKIKEILRRH